ncbi:KAP-like P-loop domain-containing protein [Mucilaginibacter yixingensis]|uniref:KAP-like P-loop domain-containing protein n=1 Tax=Mucilaginibacter yixingensis TaxID=1295612 RepID=A0A2T5J4B1_9SPHI|nr:P-loop NTPase fold protein [Mucilaginibacter yixingensis]PTQ92006.1 KAP-like P-loop domain-containing protein [Mucilaginibacter yixingensis]
MSKKVTFYVLLTILYLLLSNQLIIFYDKVIVNGFLKDLKSDWLYLGLFLLVELTVYQLIYLHLEKQKVPFFLFFASILLLATYLYYRFISSHYTFYSAKYAPDLKYTDYFIFLLGGIVILGALDRLSSHRPPVYKKVPFIIDAPIMKIADDKFDRKNFAILLAERIESKVNDNYRGAIAIGVNGNWGAGKTSFTNLIKSQLDRKNRIIIDFNPWRSLSPTKIIEDFFKVLTDQLKVYDTALSEDIETYAKSLTDIEDGVFTKTFKTGSQLFFGDKSDTVNYDKINTSIGKIGQQIIVFIDDLDRLDNKEIVEVLRLIRNTANFKNLVYVVAYDRNYVIEALRNINKHHYESYLEKIFQFEFSLPEYNPEVLRTNIKTDLKSAILNNDIQAMLNTAIDYTGRSGRSFTNWIVKTQRDAVRLCNSFLFEIDGVIKEVNVIDFYLLQLLKLKHSSLYETVAKYKTVFFIQDKLHMRLRKESERNSEITGFDLMWQGMEEERPAQQVGEAVKDLPILHKYIDSIDKSNINELEIAVIKEVFDVLLTEKDFRIGSESRDYKSFVNGENFEKYFTIQQRITQLSADEFEQYRLGDYEAFQTKIDEWLDDPNKADEVTNRLKKIVDFEHKEEWENHLKILIHIGKRQYAVNGGFGTNYKQIAELIAYPKERDGSYKFFDNAQAYKDYFTAFFEDVPEPYVFEGHILVAGLTGVTDFPLETKEIEDQLYKYFETYCAEHTEITNDFRQLHNVVVEKNNSYNYDYKVQARAEILFLDYFKRHLKVCQLSSFIRLHDPFEKYYIFDVAWIKYIFGSLEELIEYVENNENFDKNSACYIEFMKYHAAVQASAYPAILFPFEYLFKNTADD